MDTLQSTIWITQLLQIISQHKIFPKLDIRPNKLNMNNMNEEFWMLTLKIYTFLPKDSC